jgi:aldose 1-epimerase
VFAPYSRATYAADMLSADAPESPDSKTSTTRVTSEPYGHLQDGREAQLFILTNRNGMVAKVTNYGAILAGLLVPDRDGLARDLTHGFDTLEGWQNNVPYFGATVGRFGNRIAKGQFTLEGKEYSLALNNEPAGIPCHLHGGMEGFNVKLWDSEIVADGVKFSYLSPDGDEGYPGELTVSITYRLNNDNELTWDATATTTRATPVNIIHHSYWNLSGDPTRPIEDHLLTLNAERYLPTTPGMIPTGELKPVAGTPMDFREATAIGARQNEEYEALKLGNGYDHCWVLNGSGMRSAAKVTDPSSGRTMELFTNSPAIQFYAANYLDKSLSGKNGISYDRRSALCLETENFPDSPNQPAFPSCILHPGESYRHTMVHKFTW